VVGLYAVLDLVLFATVRERSDAYLPVERGQHIAGFAQADQRGPVDGWVVAWHDDAGWGVLASPELDGEVWMHRTNVPNSLRRPLPVGLAVNFSFEGPGPDGYLYQAIWVTPR
jgi:CspA family cold shock protein